MTIFDVNTIAITVLGYPLSYLELVGTVLYLASVWLIARRNILTWPIGIVSVILYFLLFYQIRLYADAAEQLYYLGASVYGWWFWRRSTQTTPNAAPEQRVGYSAPTTLIITAIVTLVISGGVGVLLTQAHVLLPTLFPEPAAAPYLDALTTVMSFTAMLLLALKRTESWIYWIIVDVIGIGLYFARDVRFVALLYVILLVIAVKGLLDWHALSRRPAAVVASPV